MKNPFIPIGKGRIAIVDGRVNSEIVSSLEKEGLVVVKTIECAEVDKSISYHPDIVIHPLNSDTIVVAPNVFDYYFDKLSKLGINLLRGRKNLSKKYPEDIAYNVARLKDLAIHNFKHTDPEILSYIEKNKIEKMDIKQGYSKCSIMIIDEGAAITSDRPTYEKLSLAGYDALLIEAGHIELPGQNYGFIGGTSGNLSKDKILISGRLDDHPNKKEIVKFIRDRNKDIIYLSSEKIIDIGTIIVLN